MINAEYEVDLWMPRRKGHFQANGSLPLDRICNSWPIDSTEDAGTIGYRKPDLICFVCTRMIIHCYGSRWVLAAELKLPSSTNQQVTYNVLLLNESESNGSSGFEPDWPGFTHTLRRSTMSNNCLCKLSHGRTVERGYHYRVSRSLVSAATFRGTGQAVWVCVFQTGPCGGGRADSSIVCSPTLRRR